MRRHARTATSLRGRRLVGLAALAASLLLAAGLLATAATAAATDADARTATTIVLAATPTVVDYGGSAVLSGRLSSGDAGDAGDAGATLTVTSSTDGLLWSPVATVGTDAQGDFSTPVTPTASYGRTTFSVAFAGSDTLQPAATQLAIDSRAALGAPSAPLSVGRHSVFTTKGSLRPTPPAGSLYSLAMSLPAAGRWRLRASYVDEAHAPTRSAYSAVVTVGALPDLPVWNRDAVTTLPERMAYRGGSRQLVVATGAGLEARYGTLSLFDYRAGDWVRVLSTPAKFGSNGLTDGRTRHEGTRTTPTGIWRMPHYIFGTHRGPPSGATMAYRRITPRSWWSAEHDSTYNTWVETARRIDGEHLADSPRSYEFAVSSGYNALPNRRVFGRGTAIFLHINHRGLTAGCVSVSRRAMIRLCRLLDPARRPVCAIGTTRRATASSIYAY